MIDADSTRHEDSLDEPPAEVRTFLIADIRGYTRFTQDYGDEAAARLAATFAELARSSVSARGGRVVELRGDEALAVFASARQALRAALELQAQCAQVGAGRPDLPLPVGMGLDAGEAVVVEGGYRGGALNLAARLCSEAGPGEVLATETVVHLARKIAGVVYRDLGPRRIKGLPEPVRVIAVEAQPSVQEKAETSAIGTIASTAVPYEVPLPTGGFLGALPDRPLADRVRERRRVESALEAVGKGEGRILLISGEAGIGKTRLAQEIALLARELHFLVATAGCQEQRQSVPFFPFIEALSALYVAAPPALRTEAPQRWPSLGRLLPEFGISSPSSAAEGPHEQERLFRSVSDLVMAVARTVPVVVLLDDLQWADPSSLDLFQHLARQMRAAPVLLGGTYRDVEVDLQHPLQSALLDLDRQQLVDWIELGRLSRQDTAEIARTVLGRQEVPDALVEQLYRRTEGNPFFVHELLRASGEAGEPTADLGHVAVPDRIRAFVGRRVAQLGANAQEVLRQASVLGSQFGFQALKAVSGRLEDELEATLEAAIRAGLVREIGVDEYAFTQPLTRQALYEELPGRRRRRLHRIAAEALERSRPPIGEAGIGREPQQDGRAAELAWHFLQADEADRALHYALLAGDQAEAVFAHRDAEQHYRTALDLVPRASEAGDGTEAKVLEKLGRVLRVVGRYPDALESLERAAQLHGEASDADGERRVAAQIGPLLAQMGRPAEGLARLQPILDSASEGAPGASQSLALLYVAYAQLLSANRRFNAAVQASERAEALARQLRDESVRAGALVRRGEALGMLGRYEESRQVLEEAVALGEAADLGTLIQALVGVGTTSTFAGQLEESRGYHERALQLAERLQDPRSIATCQTALGEIFFCLGDWMQARRLFEQAGQNLDRLDLDHLAARLRITLAYLTALEGKPAEGRPQVHEALEVVERSRDPRGIWRAHAVLAEIDLLERRYAEALLTLGQVAEPTDLYARDRTHFLLLQARARTGAGDEHTAETAVTEAITRASATHDRLSFVQALAIRGSLRTIQRRWDEAERLFEGALSVTQAMPFPHQAGRILCGFGMMEARRSRVQAAEHRLREALAIFERLGAALEADRTRRILASLKAI